LEFANRTTQVFIGFLAIVALLINSYFWRQGSSRHASSEPTFSASSTLPRQMESSPANRVDPATATREAARAAAEAHAQYMARYLNASIGRKPGMKLVAVVSATDDGKVLRDMSRALASHLQAGDVEMVESFFKPELVSDGLLKDLFSESTQTRQKLELDKTLDGLILARMAVEYLSNPSLQDVITAKLSLDVAVQGMGARGTSKTWTLTASGAGFDRNTARAMAEERILKEIQNDTKLSLEPIRTAK
jgi:hypothetical protein